MVFSEWHLVQTPKIEFSFKTFLLNFLFEGVEDVTNRLGVSLKCSFSLLSRTKDFSNLENTLLYFS